MTPHLVVGASGVMHDVFVHRHVVSAAVVVLPIARLAYLARASATVLRSPLEGIERVRGRLDRRRDRRALLAAGGAQAAYEPLDSWEPALRALTGAEPPDDGETAEFEREWGRMVFELRAQGLRVGRASYGGWNDGDPAFAHACWYLVDRLRPRAVVETGVAHGLTSRLILEGLERRHDGALWSVDLKSPDTSLHETVGAAVPERLRPRWRYIEGTSRRRLPPLLDELGEIDLFVHDSLHTGRNVRFELRQAWRALAPGGAILVDDVNHSLGFLEFVRSTPCPAFVARHDDGGGMWGVVFKPRP